MQLIILAAGKSNRIFKDINKNKCLIEVNKKTLIEKIIQDSSKYFRKINIITGFKAHLIKKKLKNFPKIKMIHNRNYYKTEMLHSLITGLKKVNDDVVISYSDIIISKKIWKIFNKVKSKEITLPIKTNWREIWSIRSKEFLDDAESLKIDKKKYLKEIGNKIKIKSKVDGQFMGLIYIPKNMIQKIIKIYKDNRLEKMQTTQFLNFLLSKNILIKCKTTNIFWYEIDDLIDLTNLNKVKSKID